MKRRQSGKSSPPDGFVRLTKRTRLAELGEDRLLEELLSSLPANESVLSGPGDDCAIVRLPAAGNVLLLKTDCVVEMIHFTRDTPAELIGWKAMMRPLSDFAAMSGVPQFALVTLMVSGDRTVKWVKEVYRGLIRAGKRFDVTIVGGETSNTRGPAAVSVSVTGFVERDRKTTRSGGRPGDLLYVTGRLGGSIRGRHLRFVPRIREARWLTQYFTIRAMMDLSDGIGADVPRLAAASKVGFEINKTALPLNAGCSVRNAISDGEDYELLFAIASAEGKRLERSWRKKFPKLRLTRIGRLNRKSKIQNPKSFGGYIHFQ